MSIYLRRCMECGRKLTWFHERWAIGGRCPACHERKQRQDGPIYRADGTLPTRPVWWNQSPTAPQRPAGGEDDRG